MPGLLRGIARTAVVAGTATAVSGRVARRQAEKFADRDADIAANRSAGWSRGAGSEQEEQAPPPPPQADMVSQLKELAELRDQGILTEEEFAAQKAKILG